MNDSCKPWQLHGFDVSVWQSSVQWALLAEKSTFAFAFVEATQGTRVGQHFCDVWNSRDPRIRCGPYQMIRQGSTGEEHAKALIELFETGKCQYTVSDLPPVLDLEDEIVDQKALPRLDRNAYLELIDTWALEVTKYFKRTPTLYTNHDFGGFLDLPPTYVKYPLWLAQYSGSAPTSLPPWAEATFWQVQKDVQVSDFSLFADLSCFIGDAEDLEAFVTGSRQQ